MSGDPSKYLVPVAIGCVDYVYAGKHHQTPFLWEIDKIGSGTHRFELIDPTKGNVPKEQIALATNPILGARSD